jgi:hypothetical protein
VLRAAGNGIVARTRVSIADISGFYAPGAKDKETKVDLVLERPGWPRPMLVNVKWSLRADREDQLWDDFEEYFRFDRDRRGFDHCLITNEFDPARLNAVCDRREANSCIFKHVVHTNTDGVLAAHGPVARGGNQIGAEPTSIERVRSQVASGRLIGLASWLAQLAKQDS